jgi:phage terminase large subunit-like protein
MSIDIDKEIREALADRLEFDWASVARPAQRLPDRLPDGSDWLYWLILAGRGFGKTRTVSEAARQWIKDGFNYVNIIGATADDVRTVSVEGPAGILACCPNSERPEYMRRSNELRWPNGATSLLFSAEEPDRLRGKQHMKLACDELAAWREPDAWDQAILGLRLGRRPQAIIATTPRPTKIIKELVADPRTYVTRGSTFDNIRNLAESFTQQIVKKFEGTRQGRQELYAELLIDTPGALWSHSIIEAARVSASVAEAMNFERIVVAIDPAVSVSESADLTGIVVCAIDARGDGYVLEDASGKMSPTEWAQKAIGLYRKWRADRIVAEVNNGGLMVETTLRSVDASIPFRAVHASRGKLTRAEPIERWKIESPIHSAEVRSRTLNFRWLEERSEDAQAEFYEALYQLLKAAPAIGLACVIDRPGYNGRYLEKYGRNRWSLCKSAFTISVERAAKYARSIGHRLRVCPERCNKTEDGILKTYYEGLKTDGPPFDVNRSEKYLPLTGAEFRETLYELRPKMKTSPMAQFADLYLWPMCMGGYNAECRPYKRLLEDGKLIEVGMLPEDVPQLGTKYYCFENVERKGIESAGR